LQLSVRHKTIIGTDPVQIWLAPKPSKLLQISAPQLKVAQRTKALCLAWRR
jgi:hypothetical protein